MSCNSTGLVRLQQLFQATNKYDKTIITIDTKRITSVDNGYQVLRELHLMDKEAEHKVLLDVRTEKAEQIILKVVRGIKIFCGVFFWGGGSIQIRGIMCLIRDIETCRDKILPHFSCLP